MATEYKNILLKDNEGKVLLPITLSYYVEYKDGTSVKTYLDTLGSSLATANSNIDGINTSISKINTKIAEDGEVKKNIINSVNQILTSYVTKPDYAYAVVFDNTTYQGLSDSLKNLAAVEGSMYVSTQQAIEALDRRITSTYTDITTYSNQLGSKIDTNTQNLSNLNTTVTGLGTRVSTVETKTNYAYANIDKIFDDNNNLDLAAGSIKYSGSEGAGTDSLNGKDANVQKAIDYIGTTLKTIKTSVEGVISQAGVSYVTGSDGILVNNKSNELQQGSVTVKVNLDNNKLVLKDGKITVNEAELSIPSSQITGKISADKIEGGLGADNINITYSYIEGGVTHEDGKKSVQNFYEEYDKKIKELEAASNATALDGKYKVTVTPSDSEEFAKVYTLTQNSKTIGTINIPKDQFLDSVYYINSSEDATSKLPAGIILKTEELAELPALVFIWKVTDSKTYSVVSIKSILGTVTNEIDTKVNALDTKVTDLTKSVETLKTSVDTIKDSYITGATINGQPVNVDNHILQLSYNILYDAGTLSEGISDGFLKNNGITLS